MAHKNNVTEKLFVNQKNLEKRAESNKDPIP